MDNNKSNQEDDAEVMDSATTDGQESNTQERIQGSPLVTTVDTGQGSEPSIDTMTIGSTERLVVSDQVEEGKEEGKLQEEMDEEDDMDDDIETFTGKIVYNPDGSAYIIEGSEVSDVESELGCGTILKEGGIIDDGSIVTLQNTGNSSSTSSHLPSPLSQSGSNVGPGDNVSRKHFYGNTVPIPKVVAAHHIQSNHPLGGTGGGILPSTGSSNHGGNKKNVLHHSSSKVPDVPIMHSYRVFTLRDGGSHPKTMSTNLSPPNMASTGSAGDHPTISTASNPATSTTPGDGGLESEGQEDVTASSGHSSVSSVPVKPILMCFICKISFGYTKSFVTHATSEHHLDLVEEESRLLGQKNVSAIIQGVGKDKEPLLSFLEPKNQTPLTSKRALLATSPSVVGQNLTATSQLSPPPSSKATSVKNTSSPTPTANNNSPPSVVASSGSSNNPGDLHQQFQQQLMAMQVAAFAAMRSSSTGQGTIGGGGQSSSVSSSSVSSSAQQQFLNSLTAGLTASNSSAPGSSPTTGPIMDMILNNTATTKDSSNNNNNNQSRPSSNGSLNLVMPKNNSADPDGVDQQDCSELADLANLEKIAKAAAAAIQSQQADFDMSQVTFPNATGSSPPQSSQSPNSMTAPMTLMSMVTSSPKGSAVQPHHPSQQQYQPGMQPDSKFFQTILLIQILSAPVHFSAKNFVQFLGMVSNS